MNSLRQKPPLAADQTVYTERGPLRLPMDLRQWVAEETVLQWVKEEVDNLDASRPEVKDYLALPQESRARVKLAVLMVAYATQVFVSEDIERACRSEKLFQALCEGPALFKEDLEAFRRKHRPLLEYALAKLLIRAVKERYSNLGKLPPGLEYGLQCRAIDRLDTARHMDTWDE